MKGIERIRKDLPDWLKKYYLTDAHYVRYTPNILAAASKIEDVYHTFCIARAALLFINCDDYGKLVKKEDELGKRWLQSIFLNHALISYNVCMDLSWQVIWLAFDDTGLDLLYSEKILEKTLKKCRWDNLEKRLKAKDQSELWNCTEKFFKDELTQYIREKYDYFKHHGTFHIKGLGINPGNLMFSFQGHRFKRFHKCEIDIDEWIEKLSLFHESFYNYFEKILLFILPSDFEGRSFELEDLMNYGSGVKEYLENKEKQNL